MKSPRYKLCFFFFSDLQYILIYADKLLRELLRDKFVVQVAANVRLNGSCGIFGR